MQVHFLEAMVSAEYNTKTLGDVTTLTFNGEEAVMTWLGYRLEPDDSLVDFMKGKTLISDQDITGQSGPGPWPNGISGQEDPLDCMGILVHKANTSHLYGLDILYCNSKSYYICELGKNESTYSCVLNDSPGYYS